MVFSIKKIFFYFIICDIFFVISQVTLMKKTPVFPEFILIIFLTYFAFFL
jgi:hypothetical protein